jgi:hypothetical protein
MPAVALSRVGARVVESGSGCQDLAAGTWQRLEALPDPRSPQERIYPLACLVAFAICAFTAAGIDRFTTVSQWIRRASQADLARLGAAWDRLPAGTGHRMRKRSGSSWTASPRVPQPGPCSGQARAPAAAPAGYPRPACAATMPGAPSSRQNADPRPV